MTTAEVIWAVACGGLGTWGMISVQQARYIDGDRDAHWTRQGAAFPLFHKPRHPQAVRAMRRGSFLLAAALALMTAGFAVRALVNG